MKFKFDTQKGVYYSRNFNPKRARGLYTQSCRIEFAKFNLCWIFGYLLTVLSSQLKPGNGTASKRLSVICHYWLLKVWRIFLRPTTFTWLFLWYCFEKTLFCHSDYTIYSHILNILFTSLYLSECFEYSNCVNTATDDAIDKSCYSA